KLLFGYGLLQLLFMLRLMPWYLRQPFNASFWSFSFGISALATTAGKRSLIFRGAITGVDSSKEGLQFYQVIPVAMIVSGT
ncbi:DUF3313 family protein, partial [Klebsiella pneumoniae]|uniref:DUF3313 family protein n=1 Tax=Klebsiella pneumoniae TaxID=573 RepID=UPI002380D8AB